MRVPLSWLRGYCDPGWDPERLAERLALTGTEVERVGLAGTPSPEGFVVGRVISVQRHPNAERLTVCEVDTGEEPRTIVCGAPNVAEGQLVPVALPGAVMPGGAKLERAKLRGVVSEGMILSEAELEMGDDADGIVVLAEEGVSLDGSGPGTPLADVLPVSDPVLELEVTPNRPDCLSVYGVAREVHAISDAPLAPAPWGRDAEAGEEGKAEDYASVAVEVPDLCPRFTARVFTEVRVGPSPLWLKARLMSAGQRPINNVVDVTNYVMLMIGQPLHAFDLDEVPGGELIVRTAREGETMITLDGLERSFDPQTVLVCDREGPSGIAGIMGGRESEVSAGTTRVLLEVATWNGVNILRTSRALGLRSEASTRFEKQLHPELAMRAQRIASLLMVELCGAKLVPGTLDVNTGVPEPRRITLRTPRVGRLIGMSIDAESCAAGLERLGFGVERDGEMIEATVPPERAADVTREVDLIEEVARLHDLDRNLPVTLPAVPERVGRLTREQRLVRRAEDALRDLGCDEVVTWSITDPESLAWLRLPAGDPRRDVVAVSNPLSREHSVMRTTLLGGLLEAARTNRSQGREHLALFESGRVYLRDAVVTDGSGELGGEFAGRRPAPVAEPRRIACLLSGSPPAEWRGERREPDFFTAKGLLEALCGRLGTAVSVSPSPEPFLHPGRAAAVSIGGRPAGWLGELHPLVARDCDLDSGAGFEVDLAPLVAASSVGRERYRQVPVFPPVHEDVAVIVGEEVGADEVRAAVLEGGGELLASAEVFDLYRGEQIGEGRKSLALRLTFQAPDRTLTDEEVAERREAIRRSVGGIGGTLRE
jgi:phenylalanyl-tRNA synthetase beta chain